MNAPTILPSGRDGTTLDRGSHDGRRSGVRAVGHIAMERAREQIRVNHAEGTHHEYREYCPDCRLDRAEGEGRR